MIGVALEPDKTVVECPDCDKEIVISTEAERYTCPACLEVFTTPAALDRSLRPNPFGRVLVIVGAMMIAITLLAHLGLFGSDWKDIPGIVVILGSLMIFFGRGMLRDSRES